MNPDQRRLLMAFAAIIVVMFIWTFVSKPSASKKTPTQPVIDTTKDAVVVNDDITGADTLVVDREAYRLVLTSTGASVKSFYLKKYRIDIVPFEKYLFVSRDSSGKAIEFTGSLTNDSLVFTGKVGKTLVRKTYRFDGSDGFSLNTEASPETPMTLSLKNGIGITEPKNARDDLRYFSVHVKNEKVTNITKQIKDELEYPEAWKWISLRGKYFVLIVNNKGSAAGTSFCRFPAVLKAAAPKKVTSSFGCAFNAAPTSSYGVEFSGRKPLSISVLLLPLTQNALVKYQQGYEQIIKGGLWAPIAHVILLIFKFFFSIFRNYGVAIIVFAVILKAIFYPLSRQMIVSQHKMQMIQPELKKIQQKFKNDPQALNQEMMHLYKTYKVNPFSGCLPLLIQMPIFFALYQTLGSSFEFRQAHFAFWITDLSIKDPFFVLPIGMGIMMLVQSLMTTVDPRQRLMVLLMPVFMIFIFLNLPSGLQLYWFTYNILTLLENYLVKKGGIK